MKPVKSYATNAKLTIFAGLVAFSVMLVFGCSKREDSEKAVFQRLEETLNFSGIAIRTKEVIHLSDGTTANYFEFTLKQKKIELMAAGVVAYEDNKIINITAFSVHFTPPAQLKDMVTTLKLKVEKP